MSSSIFVLQRRMMANAKRHGVTQEAMAAHLGCSRGKVSHLTTSGNKAREMTLGELVALLELAGDGAAAADILGPLLSEHGVRARCESEVTAEANVMRLAKETTEAVAAVLSGGSTDDTVREIDEALLELHAQRDALIAKGVH